MIKSIVMEDCASYPISGAVIEGCQKINFFYGPNGSGKSTISNYLQAPHLGMYAACQINWENSEPAEIIVYNKEFRAKHFKENIAGVFTLGQATIEDVNALNAMKDERTKKTEDYNARKSSLAKKKEEEKTHSDNFRDTVWSVILKQNESEFQHAFTGFRANKEKFRDQVLLRFNQSHSSDETRESLIRRSNTLFTDKLERCEAFALAVDILEEKLEAIVTDEVWIKVIVGNKDIPIAKLIECLDNADWVNRGRQYLMATQVCPFCQQKTITFEVEAQLTSFFSGEYDAAINKVKRLIVDYSDVTEKLMQSFESILENRAGITVSKMDEAKYKTLISALSVLFSGTHAKMKEKLEETGKAVSFADPSLTIQEIKGMVSAANIAIEAHNKMVDNYNEERKKLIDDIWTFLMDEKEALISGYLTDLNDFGKTKAGIQKSIETCKKQLDDLDEKIRDAGKNITSVQPTVDEINRALQAYGFTNFKIAPSPVQENAYQIQRMDGTLATNTLSEGEETFISFLYFLQFAKGSEDISKVSSRKVLVLDDPICSLDSTVLYIVSSMVKALIKDIRNGISDVEQLFVLTHNVFFHKEASFVDGRTPVLNDVNYWIISKDDNVSSIRSFEKNNPIKTSYELLWQELKLNSNASLVTVQNIMRRILENYFSILGKNIDDTIVNSFGTMEEKNVCRSLISWINDGSHSIPDDLYIDSYTDSIERYKDVFRDIFIKMDHKAHYDMMMT